VAYSNTTRLLTFGAGAELRFVGQKAKQNSKLNRGGLSGNGAIMLFSEKY
jgi:hypothetical protein